MRLRIIGAAVIAAGFGWLSYAHALADVPRAAGSSAVTTDSRTAPASSFTSAERARLQDNFQDDSMSPLPRDSDLFVQRIHLATAAPLVSERAASSPAPAAIATASFASSPPDQPPSVWLMLGVTLVLIGYQLRRKHRLLRPHRFHRV